MIMKKRTDKCIYIVPALITMIILLITFATKGMYPFGKIIAEEMDADVNYIPALFKIHDIFQFGDSLIWDFKIGGGANIYGSLVMNSIYNPINWLVALVKRTNIPVFFNILLIIKFMLMSTTMYIFIKKNFNKIDEFWKVLLSLTYTFSGWGYLMYSNFFFIDIVILFPIIIHYLIKLFKENKNLGFIITLSYSLILNFYLTYMIYLFIIFASLVYITLSEEKQNRKKIIINLSISLFFPILISAFSYLPTIIQAITSSRNGITYSYGYFYYFFLKTINITMSSIIIVLFIKFTKTTIKQKNKKNLWYIVILLMTTIGIIIEPINAIWHTGSYASFPYRYSFIPIFILICGAIKYLETEQKETKQPSEKAIVMIISECIIVIIAFIIKFGELVKQEMIAYDISKPGIFVTMIILFILFYVCNVYCLKIEKEKEKKIIIALVFLLEAFIYCSFSFNDYGYNGTNRTLYYDKNIKSDEELLYKYMDYQEGGIGLDLNSSYIMRRATLENWLHIIPKKQMNFITQFGYQNINTLIFAYGGTIFSDYIVGVKDIYSRMELPKEIFEQKQSINYKNETVYLYEQKFKPPFGIKYDNLIEQQDINGTFERQNYYYKKLFDSNKDIIKIKTFKPDDKTQKEYDFKIENKEKIILYIDTTEELLKSKIEELTINDKMVSIGGAERLVYIAQYDGNLDIKIKMSEEEETNLEEIKFGYIKISDYIKMAKAKETKYNIFEFEKNKLHINIDSEKEQYLFLPINNIDGWKATNNGEKINIEDELYTFVSIKLNKGNNDIKFTFEPPYLKEGIILSLFGLILLIVYSILKEKINNIKIIQKIVIALYYIISIVLLIYVYVISNFIYR